MQKYKQFFTSLYGLTLCAMLAFVNIQTATAQKKKISDAPIQVGKSVKFIGQFTKSGSKKPMATSQKDNEAVFKAYPATAGLMMAVQWKQFHPEKNFIDWESIEKYIALCEKYNVACCFALFPGFNTPDWVYDEGVQKIGPIKAGGQKDFTPLPWDPKFMELFAQDVRAFAERYNNDPRVFEVQITGHHYLHGEMHAPAAAEMQQYGITPQIVLNNWKYWIDLYGEVFSNKLLKIVVSQMYAGAEYADLPEQVIDYFVTKYQGRATLQNHQLNGRSDIEFSNNPPFKILKKYSDRAAISFEMVGSFTTQPLRQGSIEMTVYNARWIGGNHLLYLQHWNESANGGKIMAEMDKVYRKYENMTVEEMKAALKAEGKYVETSKWKEGDPVK